MTACIDSVSLNLEKNVENKYNILIMSKLFMGGVF